MGADLLHRPHLPSEALAIDVLEQLSVEDLDDVPAAVLPRLKCSAEASRPSKLTDQAIAVDLREGKTHPHLRDQPSPVGSGTRRTTIKLSRTKVTIVAHKERETYLPVRGGRRRSWG